MGASKRNQWAEAKVFASTSMTSEDEAEASSKSASGEWEEKALSKKTFFFFFGSIWHPLAAVPISLFLWGGALPHTAFFHERKTSNNL